LMLLSTGFWAPGKDFVMSFMTYAYSAAMGSRVSFCRVLELMAS
jgi:hypothetical protein